MKIVNLGFFPLAPDCLELLRIAPRVTEEGVRACEARTRLPMITYAHTPSEVAALVRTGIEMSQPLEEGDVAIFTGAPDVCACLDRQLPLGVRLFVAIADASRKTVALRELPRDGGEGALIRVG